MKKLFLASLACLILTLALGAQVFGVSNIVQSITYSPQVQGFIAVMKGDSSKVMEAKMKQYATTAFETTQGNCTGAGLTLKVCGSSLQLVNIMLLPYRTLDGTWRLRLNGRFDRSLAESGTQYNINGITFKAGLDQACSAINGNGGVVMGFAGAGSSTLGAWSTSGTTFSVTMSCDVALTGKPTWAD